MDLHSLHIVAGKDGAVLNHEALRDEMDSDTRARFMDLYPLHILATEGGAVLMANRQALFRRWNVVGRRKEDAPHAWLRALLPDSLIDHDVCFATADGGTLLTTSPYVDDPVDDHVTFQTVAPIYNKRATTIVHKVSASVRDTPLPTVDSVRYARYDSAVHLDVLRESLYEYTPGPGPSALHGFDWLRSNKNTLVVFDDNVMVGIVAYSDDATTILQVEVFEKHRRKGYARTIISDYEALASYNGFIPHLQGAYVCEHLLGSIGWLTAPGPKYSHMTSAWGKLNRRADRANMLAKLLTTVPEEADAAEEADSTSSAGQCEAEDDWLGLGASVHDMLERLAFVAHGLSRKYGTTHSLALDASDAWESLNAIRLGLDGAINSVHDGDVRGLGRVFCGPSIYGTPPSLAARADYDADKCSWIGIDYKHIPGVTPTITEEDKTFIMAVADNGAALAKRVRPLLYHDRHLQCKAFVRAVHHLRVHEEPPHPKLAASLNLIHSRP